MQGLEEAQRITIRQNWLSYLIIGVVLGLLAALWPKLSILLLLLLVLYSIGLCRSCGIIEISAGLMVISLPLAIYRYDLHLFQLSPTRLFLICGCVFFFIYLSFGGKLRKDYSLIPLLGLLLVKVTSLLWSPNLFGFGLKSLLYFVESLLTYLLIINIFSHLRSYTRFFKYFLAMALLIAVMGGGYQLFSVVSGSGLDFPFIEYFQIAKSNIAVQKILQQGLYYSGGTMIPRLTSFFEEPNSLAAFLILLLPFYFIYFLSRKKPLRSIVIFIITVGGLGTLLGSLSRSSILAFALGGIVVLIYDRVLQASNHIQLKRLSRSTIILSLIGIIGIGTLAAWHFGILSNLVKQTTTDLKLFSEQRGSFYGHFSLLAQGARLLASSPIALPFGVGEGGAGYLISGTREVSSLHNVFALILVENGIFGLLFIVVFFTILFKSIPTMVSMLKRSSSTGGPYSIWLRQLPYAGLWVLVNYVILGILYGQFVFPFIWVTLGIIRAGYFLIKDMEKSVHAHSN
jgi:hypothetical protein